MLTGKAPPGAAILLDKFQRRKKGVPIPNSIQAEFVVRDSLAFDLDCRKLIEHITIRLATHYQNSLLLGKRADGGGDLPHLAEGTKAINLSHGESRIGEFGAKSGFMATNWILGKIRGSTVKASRIIKPNGADGRSHQINRWLTRPGGPVDLQSVDGRAARVIQEALQEYTNAAFGHTVATPRIPKTLAGVLPMLKR